MLTESPILATLRAARTEGLSTVEVERRVWERHGTVCAMLALDSSGMLRISRGQGIVHFLSRYMAMRDLARPILEREGCHAWRCFADNLFAEFPTTAAALAAARAIHAAIHDHGVMVTAQEPYRVCIGIGFGRVLNDGAVGVMGDEMNLVAKLAEDIAEGGETVLTAAAHRDLNATDLPVEERHRTISQVEVTYYCLR